MVLLSKKQVISLYILSTLLIVPSIEANAQSEDSISTQYVNEVVVSASRTSRPLKNIPHSVFILSSKALTQDLSVSSDITDVLGKEIPGFAPGAQTSNNTGQGLRGRSALIMVDGIPQSTPLRNGEVDLRSIDPAVIERVEVIKGATAIYGNGATGGIINFITKSPDSRRGIHGQTSINLTGGINHPSNTFGGKIGQTLEGHWGKWNGLVSANFEQTGQYKDANGKIIGPNYSLGETDFSNLFGKIMYKISPNQKLTATYNFKKDEQHTDFKLVNGDYLTGTAATGVLGAQSGVPTGAKGNHNAHLQYMNSAVWKNTSLTADAYFTKKNEIFYYSAGRFDGSDGQSELYDTKKGVRAALNSQFLDNDFITSSLTYGLDLLNNVTSQPLVDGRTWVPKMHMNSVAPFAETEWILNNNLIVDGGFRFESSGIKVDDYQTLRLTDTKGNTTTPSIDVKGGKLKYNAALFNVGIKYNRFKVFSPYASFSQGFSVTDIGLALRASKVSNIKDINTKAVKVNNYEVGIISNLGKLRLEASAYYSTSKLGTEMVFDSQTGSFITNRRPEHVYGFELLANYRVNSKLELNGSFSYVEGKQDTASNGHYNYYMNGRRIAPPKVTASVDYSPLEGLNLRLQYMGILSRDRFEKLASGLYNAYEGPVSAYHLFSFSGSYDVNKNLLLTLGIDNLFNRDYFPARAQYYMINSFYAKGRGSSFNLGVVIKY